MSADPSVIAFMNTCAAGLKIADTNLSRWIASAAVKLVEGIPLSYAETAYVEQTVSFLAVQLAAAPAQQAQAGLSLASAPAASGITLSLSGDQAQALTILLEGQTDIVLVGIAQALAAAQSGATA